MINDVYMHLGKGASYPARDQYKDGDVYWSYSTRKFNVYHCGSWQEVDISIQEDLDTQAVMSWARKKMQEEAKIDEMRKEYPALDDALQHLEIIKAVIGSYEG